MYFKIASKNWILRFSFCENLGQLELAAMLSDTFATLLKSLVFNKINYKIHPKDTNFW